MPCVLTDWNCQLLAVVTSMSVKCSVETSCHIFGPTANTAFRAHVAKSELELYKAGAGGYKDPFNECFNLTAIGRHSVLMRSLCGKIIGGQRG